MSDTGTMRAALILAAIVATLGPGDAGAQARRTPQQRLEAERRADLVLYYVSQLDGAARALPAKLRSTRLLAAIDWMRGKAHGSGAARRPRRPRTAGGPDPAWPTSRTRYMAALQRATDVLRQEPSAAAVEDVALDLEAKVAHCRRLKIGMGGTVVLRVNTRRDGVDVRNLEVQYIPKFFEFVKGGDRDQLPWRELTRREARPRPAATCSGLVSPSVPASGALLRRVDVYGQPEVVVDLPVTFP